MPGLSRKKILVVDDDVKMCNLLKDVLEREDYEVFEVHRGDAAISSAQALHPDLILLDVLLPGALDGVQTYHRLKGKSSTRHIPVLFVTGTEPGGSVRTQQLPLGEQCGVVGKPFQLDVLLREIRRLLGQAGSAPARAARR
ncbi:MAG: hypothetical protein A3D28_04895 [Omnitrophica bacterium RIFCSPHIGHO2_02_FULL_63_14]|nr:MAG: hypothetical protein A3D28_04895 [Omnitrophica bacterium RIFCSPHIGHO2_02_FULL_63_14]